MHNFVGMLVKTNVSWGADECLISQIYWHGNQKRQNEVMTSFYEAWIKS